MNSIGKMRTVEWFAISVACILGTLVTGCKDSSLNDHRGDSGVGPSRRNENRRDESDRSVPVVIADENPRPDTESDGDGEQDKMVRPRNRHLNPGHPVFASAGEAKKCNDGEYGADYWGIGTGKNNAWTAPSPAWCALNLEDINATRVLIALSDEQGTANTEGWPGFRNYVISTSADSTNGADGVWHRQLSVTGNTFGYREHRIPFQGQHWIRVTVRTPSTAVIDELDVWDVSDDPQQMSASVLWLGDSITARCADRHGNYGTRMSLQKIIHDNFPPYYPLQIGAGTVGIGSADILRGHPSKLDTYLTIFPDVHFWCVALGTNESNATEPGKTFHANLTRIVDRIEAAGHRAIIARIPYSLSPSRARAAARLNMEVDKVTSEKNLTPGPDLYNLFKHNADSFFSDGERIHPNRIGCTAWQQAWAEVIGPLIDQSE